jgi:guanylate kinase
MNNKIFIISGPSGAGEDTVINGLKKYFKLTRVVTTVTRKKTSQEKQGNPYYFISKKEFELGLKQNKFVEWADVYGSLYGTTFEELKKIQKEGEQKNKIGIWKIDWQGVKTVKIKMPNIISIMIEPPSIKSLEKRLIKRERDSVEDIEKRLKAAKIWLKHKDIYDYRVINYDGKIDEAVEKTAKIIKKHLTK